MVDGVGAQENNITKVVVILIVIFIVCETPPGINQLVTNLTDEDNLSILFGILQIFTNLQLFGHNQFIGQFCHLFSLPQTVSKRPSIVHTLQVTIDEQMKWQTNDRVKEEDKKRIGRVGKDRIVHDGS